MNEPILVSKREAAKALSISIRTLDYLIASKQLAARRIGKRVLVPRRALESFARRDHPTTVKGDQ
jgi:excisionase family DNA binding protein